MTEQAKVPAIRFAGFTDPWEQRKLGELEKDATLYMGRGRVISAKDMSNTPGTFPVYSSSALDNGRMGAYGKYMFNQELITWSIDGGGAVFYRRKHRFSVTNVSGYIAVNPEKINCKFLAYAMSLAHSRIKFDYTVKAHPSVIRSLYTMGIPISLQEQQVIGSFFSRLDNLITLHQRKYDKLVIFKKSMLEKMFPKDGESVPEIRFAGFTDPWEQRKFVDFVEASGIRNKDNLQLESYSVSNDRGFVPQDEQFENGGTMRDADKTAYWIVEPGSFAYNPARINVGSIGYQSTRKNVIVSSLYEVFKTDRSCDDRFLWHWFKSSLFTKQIEMLQEGGVRLYFFFDKLQKSEIWMPNVDEQRIIGQQFDQLDSLITLHQRKLELLQNIKKSLLDKMFV